MSDSRVTSTNSDDPSISRSFERPATESPATATETSSQIANGHINRQATINSASTALSGELLPNGKRSLAGIAIRAFCLGTTLGASVLLTALAIWSGSRLWRPTAFLGVLSLFHFLEFWTTAFANTPTAVVSSFLLTNGAAYRIAHTAALFEVMATSILFPGWQDIVTNPIVIGVGIILIALGQAVRSVAMLQAGTNFNHKVQTTRNAGHTLVTGGLYAFLRHPSYFGFFWWGIGTQFMLGNTVCLVAYAGVLWSFFNRRIQSEEQYLTSFFPEAYPAFKAQVPVLIPFIR